MREHWASRLGLVLAMAGNAVGLGNFLRFPVQAAENGGGAFMIPYIVAMVLVAVPLMWVEWSIGRYGGLRGHGSAPGMFERMWHHPAARYLGALGIFLPLAVAIYYTYIESWTLGYSFFSLSGALHQLTTRQEMGDFLRGFIGFPEGHVFVSYLFFVLTVGLNAWVMYGGVAKGIERLAKIAMPALFVFAFVLVVRAFTLGAPHAAHPQWTVANGLAFIWNPNLHMLGDPSVWLAATGQVFFTLSIGMGTIHTYASYLREKDDVALTGLTTAMTNEFAEVILGGSLAIPIAFAFFGPVETTAIAKGGAFNLGFMSLPLIFQQIPGGTAFGTLWFLLLFFAGITSSVALAQPAVAFLEDELGLTRQKAVLAVWGFVFVCAQLVVFGTPGGATPVLDEIDFWAGTFGLVVFALIEMVIFGWIFGIDKGWAELTKGADIQVPRFFRFVIKWVTPLFLLALLGTWTVEQAVPTLLAKGRADIHWIWAARALMLFVLVVIVLLIRVAWQRRNNVEVAT